VAVGATVELELGAAVAGAIEKRGFSVGIMVFGVTTGLEASTGGDHIWRSW